MEKDFVIVRSNGEPIRFAISKEIIIYGCKSEALKDCSDGDIVIPANKLSNKIKIKTK